MARPDTLHMFFGSERMGAVRDAPPLVFGYAPAWLQQAAFDARMKSRELHRMAQDLGLPKAAVAQHGAAVRYDREFVRLAFREVARDTDERTLTFGLLPTNGGLGHTLFANAAETFVLNESGALDVQAVSPLRLLFAMAWFNSVSMDWLARFVIQIHVSLTCLYRLPVPQPSDSEILTNADCTALAKNALLLTLAASRGDFAELAPLFHVHEQHVPVTPKAMDTLRAENDRIVARLYGTTAAEFSPLLGRLKGMATQRPEYLALLQ